MIGDILFYRNKGTLPDILIDYWEGNKNDFVHVAVQVSDTKKIEALFNGVTISDVNNSLIAAHYALPDNLNMEKGIGWLFTQVGKPYGYGDVLDAILNAPVFECHYDCSALAAKFLTVCGMSSFSIKIHMTTPQGLAEMLGVK